MKYLSRSAFLVMYRLLSWAIEPFAESFLLFRLRKNKEDSGRLEERLGHASLARPAKGSLIWIHAASVGESLSMLPLMEKLNTQDRILLLTTGTLSSARLMNDRLPKNVLHQFIPLDTPHAVRRFISYWQPALAIWTESELWPNLIGEMARRNIPLLLVNARMSERSYRRWRTFAPYSVRQLLHAFSLCLAQNEESADRLRKLGASRVKVTGNLKHDAPPLPVDAEKFSTLQKMLGARPRWLAASTHRGEEEIIIKAHKELALRYRDLLTFIVPRHPERGADICALARKQGLSCAQRSQGMPISADLSIYVADTLGELGVFYKSCQSVFMGGSLVAHGGQNPLEAARFSCALLAGAHTQNFKDIYATLEKAQALERVRDGQSLKSALENHFTDTRARDESAQHAFAYAQSMRGALARVMEAITPYLPGGNASHAQA